MSKYKYEKQFMFSSRKLEEIELFLENEEQALELLAIRDAAKNTVIHHCAHHNQLAVLDHYIKYYRKNLENQHMGFADIKARTKLLLDQPNAEGYTAAHFAAYRGNVAILRLLDKYEATLEQESALKMTLLHMAAQGDRPNTMLYLHNRRFDLNAQDAKLSTPLHWAAYAASEKVAEYLLAQPDIQIDLRDQSGQTPLHLSTTYGNIKIVKKLLVAGADRSLKDHKGQTALEIAEQNEFHSIRKMLDDRYSLLDYLKIICGTKVRYAPRHRSCLQPLLFFVLALLLASIIFVLLQPLSSITLFLQSGVMLVTLGLFLSLIVAPTRPISLRTYQDYCYQERLSQLCMWCVRPMLPREHHCAVCGICVKQYDHHCFWINNCVGRHNLARFIIFLFATEILLLWLGEVAVELILMAVNQQTQGWFYEVTELLQVEVWHLWVAGVFTSAIVLLFAFPLLCLILVQCKNLLLGRTTYQRFSKSTQSILTRQGSAMLDPSQSSPQPSLQNCMLMCCGGVQQEKPPSQSNSTHSSFIRHR